MLDLLSHLYNVANLKRLFEPPADNVFQILSQSVFAQFSSSLSIAGLWISNPLASACFSS